MTSFIHSTADVSKDASIGHSTRIWNNCQIREGASIGSECILSKDVYIDTEVVVGDRVKIQNGVSIYYGVEIESGVFCGPHCVFTNDKYPRSINPDGLLKSSAEWQVSQTLVRVGASIGAHATIVCGITIGRWAVIGAGAVVTRDVPDFGVFVGIPARQIGYACPCGRMLVESKDDRVFKCESCDKSIEI